MVFLHIVPNIGTVLLAKLTSQQVQQLYTALVKSGLSSMSVRLLHGVLHRAFKDALRLGLVQRNVTEMVRIPRRTYREMRILSEEQVRQFLAAAHGERFEALFVLAVSTGMRRGELLGLLWEDINFDRAFLVVRRSVQREGSRVVIADTKTVHSRRRIALSCGAVEALRAHRERQEHEKQRLGEAWNTTYDLVFPNESGRLMMPGYVSYDLFSRVLEKAGLSHIRFHDLRHTAATLLLVQGINPKEVSEMLGHSRISITLDVYSHVTPHMQEMAAQAMDEVLGHTSPGSGNRFWPSS
jgi:integrase